jgi:hypothetical protein
MKRSPRDELFSLSFFLKNSIGAIDDKGLFPGSIKFASDGFNPK